MYNNINLVHNSIQRKVKHPKRNRWLKKLIKFIILLIAIFFVISFILSSKVIFSQVTFGQALNKLPVVSQIRTILGNNDALPGKDSDRLNFLLLGIGGAGHDGALLTDTIMIGSIQLSTKRAVLVSIPRDMLVKIPGNGYQKINHADAYGDVNNYPGGGSALTAKTIEQVFGIPIHYYLRVDFSGFKQIIDHINGVDVYVDRSFSDEQYPTDDHLIETISFEKGWQHMDGATALKFVRSRHGNNGEGSDFARSKRQQKIIFAVKEKLLDLKMLAKPNKIYQVLEDINSHTQTNISAWNFPELVGLLKNIDVGKIEHYVIDDSPGGLLKPIITDGGAFVLVPKSGDLSEVQEFMQNIFVLENIKESKIGVIIANGTEVEGLATHIGATLKSWGFTVRRLINSPRQGFEKTVIYDLTSGQETSALKILKTRLNANTAKNMPEFLEPTLYRNYMESTQEKIPADFLVVVGADQGRAIKAVEEWRQKQALLGPERNDETKSKEAQTKN